MATLGTRYNLADYFASRDPDGGAAKITRILKQTNEIIDDMLWMEGNLPTGHQATIETGMAATAFRKFNQGVATSKGSVSKVTFETHQLARRSEIDEDLANLGGDLAGARMNNAEGHFEQMARDFAYRLMYGSDDGEGFAGFAEYCSADTGLNNSQNVVDGLGSGSDNTSVYFVGWGRGCFGIHPKGTAPGVRHKDLGLRDALDADNNPFQAYVDEWKWDAGLAIPDWQYVVRIANIDVSDLVANTGSARTRLLDKFTEAAYKWPSTPEKGAIYCNRDILTALHQGATERAGSTLTVDNVDGKPVVKWLGTPIRRVDALLNTEAHIA
jgi:hypothetical protein